MAAVRDGSLVDVAIERPGAPDLVGAVLRGRVAARMPALAGAFVDLGGIGEGFLPDSAGGQGVPEGSILALRVSRAAQGGKGPRLARLPDPAPPGPLGLWAAGPDALERLATLHPDAAIIADDAALVAARRGRFGERLSLCARAFDEATEAEVEALAERRCGLPGGGVMTIEPTSALVAIDVDLAAGSGEKTRKTAAHVAANTRFLPEIARQIRLRNLAGPILLDLAGLSPRRRAALAPALQRALADDPLTPRFLGFSALGFAEILRTRVHAPLHEIMGTAHAAGLAALRELAREQAADPSRAPILSAAADVADALTADTGARAAFATRCGRALVLRTDRRLPPGFWRIEST